MSQRAVTFQQKVLLALIGVGVMATALVCTLLITIHFFGTRRLAYEEVAIKVRVVAIHSEAALTFDDAKAGAETLHALQAAPSINWAALYDAQGALFAAYNPPNGPSMPGHLRDLAPATRDQLLIRQPVVQDDQFLGTVVASYDLEFAYQQLWRSIILSMLAAAVVAAIAVAVALRLRRLLTRPMRALVNTARHISDTGDYTARAERHSRDEFGELTDTFNAMLDRIEHQDKELHRRNEEMQQFLFTVSHDLKSPLVTISGFVGVAREDLAQKAYDQLDTSLDYVVQASQHMGRLIDDLLTLSRLGRVPNQPEWLNVTELVRNMVSELAPRIEKTGAKIEVQPDMPRAYADRIRLRQALENLLINALKYGITPDSALIEIGGQVEGDEVQYFVRDHGPGIPEEYRERIFVLFQRLSRSPEGTGVGLTIAGKIAEAHGGRLWFEPTPGGGATFWIALPNTNPTSGADRG